MQRTELQRIIGEAADQSLCAPEDRARLVAAVGHVRRVAVGQYRVRLEGVECDCPVVIAGYFDRDDFRPMTPTPVKRFTAVFDLALRRRGYDVTAMHVYYVTLEDE